MVEVLKALRARLILPMHYFNPYTLQRFLERIRDDFPVEMATSRRSWSRRRRCRASPRCWCCRGTSPRPRQGTAQASQRHCARPWRRGAIALGKLAFRRVLPGLRLGLVGRALPAAVLALGVAQRVAVIEHGVDAVGDEIVGRAHDFGRRAHDDGVGRNDACRRQRSCARRRSNSPRSPTPSMMVAPMPIRQLSPMRQPCRTTRCVIEQ